MTSVYEVTSGTYKRVLAAAASRDAGRRAALAVGVGGGHVAMAVRAGQDRPRDLAAGVVDEHGQGPCGLGAQVCHPTHREHKEIVERNNDYLETSFLPGRAFASPAGFNAQLAEWLALANSRIKRMLGCAGGPARG